MGSFRSDYSTLQSKTAAVKPNKFRFTAVGSGVRMEQTKREQKMPAKTIDEYLATLSPDKRAALNKLRKQIKALAPKAEECISYGIPTFRFNGKALIYFGAGADHCAVYGAIPKELQADLKKYDTSKGTIRFQPNKPLPAALVKKIVKIRMRAMKGR
jgi:uncharacterized protein YdhG (YjbR/CyaY superfamily)